MIIDRKNKYKGYLNIDEITYKTKSGKEGKRELMVRQNAVAALISGLGIRSLAFRANCSLFCERKSEIAIPFFLFL